MYSRRGRGIVGCADHKNRAYVMWNMVNCFFTSFPRSNFLLEFTKFVGMGIT